MRYKKSVMQELLNNNQKGRSGGARLCSHFGVSQSQEWPHGSRGQKDANAKGEWT